MGEGGKKTTNKWETDKEGKNKCGILETDRQNGAASEVMVSVCCFEQRAEPKGKLLHLLAVGSDQKNELQIKVAKSSLRASVFILKDRARSSE